MSNQNDIRNLTQIQDKNITFSDPATEMKTIKGKMSICIHGSLSYNPKCCAACGIKNEEYIVEKHGFSKPSLITLGMTQGNLAYLSLRKQRFKCKACHSTFTAQPPIVNENCYLANLLKVGIISEATTATSVTDIATRHNTSWHKAMCFMREAAKEMRPFRQTLPKHLSFDEFKYKKSAMAFDYVNAETGEILGILSSRRNYDIKNHFKT